jgi:CRP-like cAMP-binding protein
MIDAGATAETPRNLLLARLNGEGAGRLRQRLQRVQILVGQRLAGGGPSRTVYFPETAIVSQLLALRDGTTIEVATVGPEGVVGLSAFLGAETPHLHAIGQVPGDAWRIDADVLRAETDRSPQLHELLHAYAQAFVVQLAQSVACNRHHAVEARAARWLLTTADRLDRTEFRLTQEALAMMLGVHRPSVSLAAGALQRSGMIRYRRGHIRIVDRDRLEAAACECYEMLRDAFDRILGE